MASKKSRNKQPADETLTEAGALVAGLSGHKPYQAASGDSGKPNEIHMDWYRQWTRMGRSISRIAQLADVHHSSVHEAVLKVQKWIFDDGYLDAKAHQKRLTEICDFVIEESLASFEKSKDTSVVVTTKEGTDDKGAYDETSTVEFERYGDMGCLNQARGAMSDIRALWGLDAPKKSSVSFDDEMELLPVEGMTPEEAIRQEAHRMLESIGDAIPEDSSTEE